MDIKVGTGASYKVWLSEPVISRKSYTGRTGKAEPGLARPSHLLSDSGMWLHLTTEADSEGLRPTVQ